MCFWQQSAKINPNVWTEEEKIRLAEAIDMYGIQDPMRLAERVATKKRHQVEVMLKHLQYSYRKEIECYDMKNLSFIDLNTMDDLFLISGTKPKEVMIKWMNYLESFYLNDPFKYDKFKLFSKAFLLMSECSPDLKACDQENDQHVDFRW